MDYYDWIDEQEREQLYRAVSLLTGFTRSELDDLGGF